jgi:hypothetical protein
MKYFNTRGVGGWLALFCMGQIIVGPLKALTSVGETMTALKQNVEFYERYPELHDFYIFDMVMSLAMSIYGIVVGIYLFKIKHGAVKITKQYLLVVMSYGCIQGFSPLLFRGLPETQNLLWDTTSEYAIQSLIIAGVWYAYFIKSIRVKNTYLS